jgi:hypothetical protein
LNRLATSMTHLMQYKIMISDVLCFGRLYCRHFCDWARLFGPFVSTHIHRQRGSHHDPHIYCHNNHQSHILTISYRSADYRDELVWAAAWLYRATNDNSYLNTAESLYDEFGLQYWGGALNWDNKVSGVQVRYVKNNTFTMSIKTSKVTNVNTHRKSQTHCSGICQ